MSRRSVVLGTGHYLPEKILTNEEISQQIDTSHEWIVSRTGIHQRHIADPTELTSDLAAKAAQDALKSANLSAEDIDLIVVATTTPDQTFPATAVAVQHKIGAKRAFAFDIQAVCSGFLYALTTVDCFLRAHPIRHALVIGAETMSRLLNWEDRTTCVLFGDGAGALVLQNQEDTERGILSSHLYSDGRYKDILCVPNCTGFVHMQGRDVFKHAVEFLEESVANLLKDNGLKPEDIDWFVPHQANIRIIQALANRFSLPIHKFVLTIDRHANTSAASIPLALDHAHRQGLIRPGHLIVCKAIGGGLTWGALLLRW